MNQPDPIDFKIEQVYLDSDGLIECSAWINNEFTEYSIDPSHRLYPEVLPPNVSISQVTNHEQNIMGWMDDWYNAHFLVKYEGQIVSRVVRLEEWIKTRLKETYLNNQ